MGSLKRRPRVAASGDAAAATSPIAAIAMTVTAVGARAAGFVTVWPDGQPLPDASVVNPTADGAAANGAIVVGVNGLAGFNIRTNTPCHLICDISGYWSR